MGDREGRVAMAAQRDLVMQLLGSVSNADPGFVSDFGENYDCYSIDTDIHRKRFKSDSIEHCQQLQEKDNYCSTYKVLPTEMAAYDKLQTETILKQNESELSQHYEEDLTSSSNSLHIGNSSDGSEEDDRKSSKCRELLPKKAFLSRYSQSSNSLSNTMKSKNQVNPFKSINSKNYGEICESETANDCESSQENLSLLKADETMTDLLKRAKEYCSRNLTDSVEMTNGHCNEPKLDNTSSSSPSNNGEGLNVTVNDEQSHLSDSEDVGSLPMSPSLISSQCTDDGHQFQDSKYNFTDPTVVRNYQMFQGFTKGCHWSPDGSRLLVLSSNQVFHVLDCPDNLESAHLLTNVDELDEQLADNTPLMIKEGELVYDYKWYPGMSQQNPSSRCFVNCSRALPVHMWNCDTGGLVCSYRPFNHLDELAPALSVGFSRDGALLVCGFDKMIRIFNTQRPGRTCTDVKAKKQNGVISCFDFHPQLHHVMAAGSYLGSVGLYNLGNGSLFSLLHGHTGGVTQISFSDDGYRLYSGARKDKELLCWDIRQMGQVLHSYHREVETQQRISFHVKDDLVVSGATDGVVRSWRGVGGSCVQESFVADSDCINGVSLHPTVPVLATSSGQRRRADDRSTRSPSVKLWWLGQ